MVSNSSNISVNSHQPHHAMPHDSAIIFFIFGSCAVGALTRRVIQGLNLSLPYTVVLLVLGVLFGLLSSRYPEVHVYATVVETDPHLILSIFLPVLIFESAFAMEVHTFIKAFVQVVLLAIPGLALASFLTAILGRYLFTYDWDWNTALMFGAILSATDPVAVVALLRDIGASKQLAMIIEGEALLNDGAAIVFFNVFLKLTTNASGMSGGGIVVNFIQVAIGGPFVGYIMAKLTLFWLSRIFNDALAEITITLASTYVTYYVVEEFFQMSGVLAVVVLGLTMNSERTMISPEVDVFLHRFWETLAYLANTLIFIIVGIVISEKAIFEIHGIDWFYMFSLYFGCFIIRGFVIALFSPILRRTGYGLTWKEGIVMTWGGLRGAVGLALALQVAHHDTIDQEQVGVRVLIHVSGVVFLTLLVNATTFFALLKALGMSGLSPAKRMAMANSLRYLQDLREKTLNMLKTDRFLADAEWETVEKQTEVTDPYKTTDEEAQVDDTLDIKQSTNCPDCDCQLPPQYTRKELRDMTNEAILRMLKAEKMSYWRQFEQGMLSREATRKLQECTEVAADTKGKFIDIEEIKKSWEIPNIQNRLEIAVKKTISHVPDDLIGKDSKLRYLDKIIFHRYFKIFFYCITILDMFNVAFSIASEYAHHFFGTKNIFRSINVVFVALYIIELCMKVAVVRRLFLKSMWNVLSLVIVTIGIIDMIINFSLPAVYGEANESVHVVIVVFILLRTIRILRLIESIMPYILDFIKRRMSQHLSYGFDVGRGFVAGEEEVRKLIDHMSDHKDIAKTLKQMSDNGRLEVIRCLGMLSKQHPDIALSIKTRQAIRSVLNQLRDGIHELMADGILEEAEGNKLEKVRMLSKQHPDIALSIKTRQAIRSVLNQLRDGIHELMADGILEEAEGNKLEKLSKQHPDIALSIKTRQAIRSVLNQLRDGIHELMADGILEEAEGNKLEKIVEEKMKRLMSAPPSMEIPPPDKMLVNVTWLQNDPDLIHYIKEKAKLLNFDYDDIVMREGDPADGIYIIVSGMVRLESSNPSSTPIVALQEKPSGSSIAVKAFVLDFMTSGNIIGEMGLLTHKPRSATVVCETSVQMLFISLKDMQHAIEKFKGHEEPLEYRLWHVCAIRIAANILMKQPSFQGWTKEKIKMRLESSYLFDLTEMVFIVDSSMSNVILINGTARNPFTDELFEGPCYIPWEVFKLEIIPEHGVKPVLLIVPCEVNQPLHSQGKKLSEQQRGHGAVINKISQLCLKHASKHRMNAESKWRKVQNAKKLGTLFNQNKITSNESHDDHKVRFENGGIPSSGTGLHQKASSPRPAGEVNLSFDDVTDPSYGESRSSMDDCKVNITLHSSDTNASLKRKHSGWSKLKRRFSHDEMPHHREPHYEAQVLPDDLEYIEGGDIAVVHSEHHYLDSRTASAMSNAELAPLNEDEENDASRDTSNNNDNTDSGNGSSNTNTPTATDNKNNNNTTNNTTALPRVVNVANVTSNADSDKVSSTEKNKPKDGVQKSKIFVTKAGKTDKPVNKTPPLQVQKKPNGAPTKKDQSPDRKSVKTHL